MIPVFSVRAFRLAALLGFLAVALGAFGAHGMERAFAEHPQARDWWQKAVFYHSTHAVVLLGLACLPPAVWATRLFCAGIVLFSGSLYLAAAGGPWWLVHVTPFGGLCLLAGWLVLAVRPPASPVRESEKL